MFFYSDTADAPWTVIKSNDKKPARLEAMRHVLRLFDHPGKDLAVATEPDRLIVGPAAEVVEFGEQPGHFPPLAASRTTATPVPTSPGTRPDRLR
jgi:hypothetical protein